MFDENDEGLNSIEEISVMPLSTEQPLAGTTTLFLVNGYANFTDLALMQPAGNVRLLFRCESCVNLGGALLSIEETSAPFNIEPALNQIAFEFPRPSNSAYEHPVVAGVVSCSCKLDVFAIYDCFSSSSVRNRPVLMEMLRVQNVQPCEIRVFCFNYTRELSSYCAAPEADTNPALKEVFG